MKPPPEPTIVPNAPTATPIRTSRTATVGENVIAEEGFARRLRAYGAPVRRCGYAGVLACSTTTASLVRTSAATGARSSLPTMFEPLRDPQLFREVRVDAELGAIAWPNGADIDPDTCTSARHFFFAGR